MKAIRITKYSLLALAISYLLSACYDPSGNFNIAGSYSSGSSYLYDSSGYPIYGYYGSRPIYAYDTSGSPIFSINLIRSGCYVPTWGPAPHFRGTYVRPPQARPMASPPMKQNFRPDHIRHPQTSNPIQANRTPLRNDQFNRPGNIRNNDFLSRPSLSDKRPDASVNRPTLQGNRPNFSTGRPTQNPSQQSRPNFQGPSGSNQALPGNRPNLSSSDRTQRPQMNQGGNRPSFGNGARPNSPQRPTSSQAGPQRPQQSSAKPSENGGRHNHGDNRPQPPQRENS